MTILADVPTVGLYVGWAFCVIVGLLLLAAMASVVYAVGSSGYDRDDGVTFAVVLVVIAVVVGLITLAAMWPLKYEYHHYVSKRGVVETVAKRIVSSGDNGISERYVVKLVGDPYPYGIDDTRASLIKPGVMVGIKCKKEHQFFQPYEQNGWACRWGA